MVAQQQEAIVGENSVMMIKGKRTKRPRPVSPLALTMSSTATTTDEGGSAMSEELTAPNSVASSEEEHDMAHCLILLAQGTNQTQSNSAFNTTTTTNNYHTNNTLALGHKGNMGISSSSYECKTCNKSFASFQALGGHRASHKKPKPNTTFPTLSDLKKSPSSLIFSLIDHDNHHHHHHDDGTTLSLQMANSTLCPTTTTTTTTTKTKVHECGICGAEFSSGQALGGHMRRHRPIGMPTTTTTTPPENSLTLINAISKNHNVKDVKTTTRNNHFSLDLNLPAPEDEHHHLQQQRDSSSSSSSKFVFSSNEKTLVFAAASSQLVDCHY